MTPISGATPSAADSGSGAETLTVPGHVTGYPEVAFGGYVAGLLAARTDAKEVRVDFRGTVPVGAPVHFTKTLDGGGRLGTARGDLLVAASPAELALDLPDMPSFEEAQAATEDYLAYHRENPPPLLRCFGCGPDTAAGVGLRIFPSTVPGRDLVAGAWVPDAGLADAEGLLPPEMVWAALDCPSGWAGVRIGKMGSGALTAALTGTQLRPVVAGEPYVSYSWVIGSEGRKLTAGVALATAEGELCALGEALWIKPRQAPKSAGSST
ncbi:hypothetical protein [Streptomyces sp. NBC_01304]|uniref:hypothetical protein n=1 Tax=Streptomyces sp. NBC_01304 TaxID=2903818 RepID=UPI002E0E4AD6|nr:hypothetical protein OG430_16885 [Streptomyces sp. NBC_01304]